MIYNLKQKQSYDKDLKFFNVKIQDFTQNLLVVYNVSWRFIEKNYSYSYFI